LEEWIEYLKTGNIRPDTTAPGLAEAREKLRRLSMSKAEQDAYYRHISAVMVQNDAINANRLETLAEAAKALKKNGVDEVIIAKSLGLTIEEVHVL
jgi:hypothetical protein